MKCPVCKMVDIPDDGRAMCHGCRRDAERRKMERRCTHGIIGREGRCIFDAGHGGDHLTADRAEAIRKRLVK